MIEPTSVPKPLGPRSYEGKTTGSDNVAQKLPDRAEERDAAMQAEMVRRNLLDAAERALTALTGAHVGLHRLPPAHFDSFIDARAALDVLIRSLKFDR